MFFCIIKANARILLLVNRSKQLVYEVCGEQSINWGEQKYADNWQFFLQFCDNRHPRSKHILVFRPD